MKYWVKTCVMEAQHSVLTLEHYELKYVISAEMSAAICEFLESHCCLDSYSQDNPNHYYPISSLYLDNLENESWLRSEVFNCHLRIRSYGTSPYYAEIKYKVKNFVKKRRAPIYSENWAHIVRQGTSGHRMNAESLKNLEDFVFMIETYDAHPILLTQYQRKAYESPGEDGVRVTLDRNLCAQATDKWCLYPEEFSSAIEVDPQKIILEFKCKRNIPAWLINLVHEFQLVDYDISKFDTSLYYLKRNLTSVIANAIGN